MRTHLAIFSLLLLSLGFTSWVLADDDDSLQKTETILFTPSSESDAREFSETLSRFYRDRVVITPIRSRNSVLIQVAAEDRDQVLELLERLSVPPSSIRSQLFLIQSADPLSEQDVRSLSGPLQSVTEKIGALEEAGTLTVTNHSELTSAENQDATMQIGETLSIATGITTRGNQSFKSYKQIQTGTILTITGKAHGDLVAIEIRFEKTGVPASTNEEDEVEGTEFVPGPGPQTLSLQTSLNIANGHAVLLGGMHSTSRNDSSGTSYLVLGVELIDPAQARREMTVRSESRNKNLSISKLHDESRQIRPSSGSAEVNERLKDVASQLFDRYDKDSDGILRAQEQGAMRLLRPGHDQMTKDEFIQWMARGTDRARQNARRRGRSPGSN